MISKIEMTVDFVKAKSKIKKFQLEATNELLGDPAEIVKKRINEGKIGEVENSLNLSHLHLILER